MTRRGRDTPWPLAGSSQPAFSRSAMLRHAREVPHAKAVVQNAEQVFVTFADLTPKALDQNIGRGVSPDKRPAPRPGTRVAPPFLVKKGG